MNNHARYAFKGRPGWSYLTLFIATYALAELAISLDMHRDALDVMHTLSGIAAYEVPYGRKNELAIHLITQTIAVPSYAYLNGKSIAKATEMSGPVTLKEAVAGCLTSIMMIWLTYTPLQHQPSKPDNTFRTIHFLIERSNFAYAVAMAISVYAITLGLQHGVLKILDYAQKVKTWMQE